MLVARGLGHHEGGRRILSPLDLSLPPGRLHAVLGPNGAGKSTLLRLLAGEKPCREGEIRLHDRPLAAWDARELARVRAVLPQTHALSFPFIAREVVALGRLHATLTTPRQEAEIVAQALARCGAAHLAERRYSQLSGGERARVQLARVLAQIWTATGPEASYLLLDEPTAHLDLAFQHACLRLAREWSAAGVGVVAVLHDPNLVLAYADTVSVLCCGELLAQGAPREVLEPSLMQRVYGLTMQRVQSPSGIPWLAVSA